MAGQDGLHEVVGPDAPEGEHGLQAMRGATVQVVVGKQLPSGDLNIPVSQLQHAVVSSKKGHVRQVLISRTYDCKG